MKANSESYRWNPPEMIQSSESAIILMQQGCKGHWGHWGCWITGLQSHAGILILKKVGRIMKYYIEIYDLFCWRLLRPDNVTFLKTGWWNSNSLCATPDLKMMPLNWLQRADLLIVVPYKKRRFVMSWNLFRILSSVSGGNE